MKRFFHGGGGRPPVWCLALMIVPGVMVGGCVATEAPAAPVVTATPVAAPSAAPSAAPASGGMLRNGDFETTGETMPEKEADPTTKSQVSGAVASEWWDNSNWGPAVVRYSLDTDNPHGGKQCQRVEFVKRNAEQPYSMLQFVQRVELKQDQPYTARIWARAQGEVEIEYGIQNGQQPYVPKMTTKKVGEQWTPLAVAFSPNPGGPKFLMVRVKTPGTTFWLDDAELTEGTAPDAATPNPIP